MMMNNVRPILEVILAVVVNLMLFLSFLLILLAGNRLENRWVERRRSRLRDQLRASGCSPELIAAVEPQVEFVVTHGSPLRVGFGLLAMVALGYLSLQSTNRTFLAVSYAGAAILFVVYVAVELYRFRRAQRVRATLRSDPGEFR
jgi:hypothetical protein